MSILLPLGKPLEQIASPEEPIVNALIHALRRVRPTAAAILLIPAAGLTTSSAWSQEDAPLATPEPKTASGVTTSAEAAPPLRSGGSAPDRKDLRQRFPDPLSARPLSPNFDLHPDSSLADFSNLLDAPAGRHGFVTSGKDGHFQFERGGRARFWGVTITQEHIDIPKHRIDEAVDNLARAGCNMVRFHSLDNRAGLQYGFVRRTLIDETPPHHNDTQHFDPEYRDRLDYWVARLKERGIYSFLVLRAFRHYKEGDQVENAGALPRGATPMAFFNRRLIELQEQFARDFLFGHVNPYTGLPLGQDPAVALIELFNEDSLFSRPHLWEKMPEPYRTEFHGLWIDYLKRSYGTTEKLRQAWTSAEGKSALQPSESLEGGTIALPEMKADQTYAEAAAVEFTDPLRSPTRRRDGVRFAVELQRKYFQQMLAALEKMGLRVPVTGVVAAVSLPDTFSAAQEFGFTAENMYQEHPEFEPGREWLPPYYYKDRNYLTSFDPHSGMPFVTLYRWAGKPVAVREWATSWPNTHRSASILEMAAYGRLQDLDALLYFAYYTTGDFTRLSAFGLNNDPPRWGMFGIGAQVFLGPETVKPGARKVQIAYSAEDLSAFSNWKDPLHQLAWVHRVENVLLTPSFQTDADLLLFSGRSHALGYKGQYGLLWSASDWVSAAQARRAAGAETVAAKSGYPVEAVPAEGKSFTFNGVGYQDGETTGFADATCFAAADLLAARLEPFAPTEDKKFSLGAYDGLRKNLLLGRVPFDTVLRIALGLLHHWYETPMGMKELDQGLLISDTGELTRDISAGLMTIDTPQVQAVQGRLTTGTVVATPSRGLEVLSQSPSASVVALSLDGEPLAESRRFLVKMVTVAENRKQLLEPATHPSMAGHLVMAVEGGTPIVTKTLPLEGRATQVRLSGKPFLEVAMENGTWEILVDLDRRTAYLFCDLPGAEFTLSMPTDGKRIDGYTVTPYTNEMGPRQTYKSGPNLTYPGWSKYAEIRF